MPQAPLPPIGAEVLPELPPIGGEVVTPAVPDFTSTNVKDVYGHAVVGDGGMGGYLEEATKSVRGINEFIQRAFWDTKGTLKGIHAAQDQLRKDAHAAFQQGDYPTATRKFVNWLLLGVGPRLDEAASYMEQGEIARGLGATTDVAINLFGHKAIPAKTVPTLARVTGPAPGAARRALAEWGLNQGIPVDVPTATGNPFLRGIQKITSESFGGSGVGAQARAGQAEALTATGARFAERTAPGRAATPETAGEALRQETLETGQARAREARAAYREVRDAEGNILNAEYVPDDLPRVVKERLREQLGEIPTPAEIQELRRIREELDAVPYSAGKLVQEGVGSSDTHYVPRSGGASVYHDILQEAPGTSEMTRGEVQRAIEVALKTGRMTNAARGALAVARKRLAPEGWRYQGISSPLLPPDAGAVPVAMALPVDIQAFNTAVEPLYQQLLRERDLTNMLPGAKGRTLMALDSLRTGGTHAPLSVVDAALSDLKALARAEIPELRSAGEGAAGLAVRELDAQVRAAAERAGPEVLAALERGRAATKAKYVAKDVVKRLGVKASGRRIYEKATAAHDANAPLLRDLQQHAPESLPLVGRAFLEELLQKATAEGPGTFQRTAGVLADWRRLGAESKRLMFRDAAHIQDIDNLFQLAHKLAENPNPSGSALTVFKGGEAGAWFTAPVLGVGYTLTAPIVAKLLFDPRATRLLLQGLKLPAGATAARAAWARQIRPFLDPLLEGVRVPGAVPALTGAGQLGQRLAGPPAAAPVGAEEPGASPGGSPR